MRAYREASRREALLTARCNALTHFVQALVAYERRDPAAARAHLGQAREHAIEGRDGHRLRLVVLLGAGRPAEALDPHRTMRP